MGARAVVVLALGCGGGAQAVGEQVVLSANSLGDLVPQELPIHSQSIHQERLVRNCDDAALAGGEMAMVMAEIPKLAGVNHVLLGKTSIWLD
jgi:hypothetical protein